MIARRCSSFFLYVFGVLFVAVWFGSDIVPEWIEKNRWWLLIVFAQSVVILALLLR